MTTSNEKKRGQLSNEEKAIIQENMSFRSDEEIAAILNRHPEVVAKFRAQLPVVQNTDSNKELVQQLHKKFFWSDTRNQLIGAELLYFEQYWSSLQQQFASQGIVPTDELMMRDLIILDIHVNRSNIAKRNAYAELEDIERQIEQVNMDHVDDPIGRVTSIEPLQNRANALRGAMKALSEEYKILADKKDKKYEQLKATRQMRLEKAEKAGRSFFDLVGMLDTPEIREKEGRMNELYKLATNISKLRFQQYHTYEDDKVDKPFLTPEGELDDNIGV